MRTYSLYPLSGSVAIFMRFEIKDSNNGAFLCGVCKFSPGLCGFSAGTPISSFIPKTCMIYVESAMAGSVCCPSCAATGAEPGHQELSHTQTPPQRVHSATCAYDVRQEVSSLENGWSHSNYCGLHSSFRMVNESSRGSLEVM
ncbi:uncharacterized protein LOC144205782 [Stigmatopora nigra]